MASPVNPILGIDYSFTCPAVCAFTQHQPKWFVHYKKEGKPYPDLPNVTWSISSATTEIKRYIELAEWVLDIMRLMSPACVVLEDYAFSANGRITQLSENTGTLKVKLHEHYPNVPVHIVAPSTIKKFATGRGIATKDDVWKAFIAKRPETTDWAKLCHPKAMKIGSPTADIADAYFLANYGHTHFSPKA